MIRRLGLLMVLALCPALLSAQTYAKVISGGCGGAGILGVGGQLVPNTVDSLGRSCGAVSFSGSLTSRDSVLAKAITVHACGARVLSSTGTPENPIGMDTTGALCTNATGGGGGGGTHDTIFAAPGLVFSGKTSTAVANGIYTTLRVDTLGNIVVDTLRHIVDSVNVSANVKSMPTVTVTGLCTSGSPCYQKIDSVPLTTGGSLDTVRVNKAVTFASKTQPAIANNTYAALQTDTAGRVRVKIDTSVTINTVVPSGGAGLGASDSVQLRTGTKHAARVAVDTLLGGVLTLKANPANTNNTYNPLSADTAGRMRVRLDSALGCLTGNFPSSCPIHVVGDSSHAGYPPGDSLQRNDTTVHMDSLYFAGVWPNDTCVTALGVKSVADSIRLPAIASIRHYITFFSACTFDTLAISGSAAYDSITTSNLPGALTWRFGNALALGAEGPLPSGCMNVNWEHPVKGIAQNTVTQFRGSACGTGCYWVLTACYYKYTRRWRIPGWRVLPPSKREQLTDPGPTDFALLEPFRSRDEG